MSVFTGICANVCVYRNRCQCQNTLVVEDVRHERGEYGELLYGRRFPLRLKRGYL